MKNNMKIKISKKDIYGDYTKVNLDITTQMSIEELVSNFLSADFTKREEMLKIK